MTGWDTHHYTTENTVPSVSAKLVSYEILKLQNDRIELDHRLGTLLYTATWNLNIFVKKKTAFRIPTWFQQKNAQQKIILVEHLKKNQALNRLKNNKNFHVVPYQKQKKSFFDTN